jgi:hypothetical protein
MLAIAQATQLEIVDDELRFTRVQILRALRAAEEFPGEVEIEEIIIDLIGRVEALELARCALRMAARLARGASLPAPQQFLNEMKE